MLKKTVQKILRCSLCKKIYRSKMFLDILKDELIRSDLLEYLFSSKKINKEFIENGLYIKNKDQFFSIYSALMKIKYQILLSGYLGKNKELKHLKFTERQLLNIDKVTFNEFIGEYVKEDTINFSSAKIKYDSIDSLYTLFNELLIDKEYFFETDKPPRIIDCGTNFGLGIYFFKRLFPDSEIICFEPSPDIVKILKDNIKENNYNNVTVYPYALSNVDGETVFYVDKTNTMAGSLTNRRHDSKDELFDISVKTVRLSKYLNDPVDFLKIDIEGSELEVLEEIGASLCNVKYLFCEYHHGNGLSKDRLTKILKILDLYDFEYQVNKAWSFGQYQREKQMNYADKNYSCLIFAKNKKLKI